MNKNPYLTISDEQRQQLRKIWLNLTPEEVGHFDQHRYGLINQNEVVTHTVRTVTQATLYGHSNARYSGYRCACVGA